MKIFKALGLALLIASLAAGSALAGQAAATSYVCTVNSAGPNNTGNGAYIYLTDTADPPAFQNQQFQVPRGRDNQFLAVALTAISLGKTVSITTKLTSSAIPMLSSMYLINQ